VVILLTDQLNTHKSASLVEWVASEISYKGGLGKKEQRGILKNMKSRAKFLEAQTHRIRFVYTPKHCSWLNPIENWFAKLQRHAITGESFISIEMLEKRIKEYIQYYNDVLFKPINWRFKGFHKNKVLNNSMYKTI